MEPRDARQRKNDVCYAMVLLAALVVLVGNVVVQVLDPQDRGQLVRAAPEEQSS